MKTNENWTIYRDSFDESGVFVAVTRDEHAALVRWFGGSREVGMRSLMDPTYPDLAESKTGARKAALAALARFDAELAERVRAESVEHPTRTTAKRYQETPINAEGWVITPNEDGVTLGIGMPGCWPECNVYDDERGRRAAALISAAPAMLRALGGIERLLRKVLPFVQCADDQDLSVSIQAGEWIGEIQDLISKAKGGA